MGVFKSVEECIDLYKRNVPCDTGFSYFYNAEEVDFDGNGEYEFDLEGDIQAQLDEIEGNTSMVIADDNTQPYSEFSFVICPAYANTYQEPQA
jgi:hypothetical protein